MFMLHQQGRVSANTSAGKSAIVLGCTQGVIKIKTNCMCSHVILIAFFELKIENAGGDGFNQFLLDTYILFLDVQNKKVTNGGST